MTGAPRRRRLDPTEGIRQRHHVVTRCNFAVSVCSRCCPAAPRPSRTTQTWMDETCRARRASSCRSERPLRSSSPARGASEARATAERVGITPSTACAARRGASGDPEITCSLAKVMSARMPSRRSLPEAKVFTAVDAIISAVSSLPRLRCTIAVARSKSARECRDGATHPSRARASTDRAEAESTPGGLNWLCAKADSIASQERNGATRGS